MKKIFVLLLILIPTFISAYDICGSWTCDNCDAIVTFHEDSTYTTTNKEDGSVICIGIWQLEDNKLIDGDVATVIEWISEDEFNFSVDPSVEQETLKRIE